MIYFKTNEKDYKSERLFSSSKATVSLTFMHARERYIVFTFYKWILIPKSYECEHVIDQLNTAFYIYFRSNDLLVSRSRINLILIHN